MKSLTRLARRAVSGRMEQLEHGRLTVHDGSSTTCFGAGAEPAATITVHDPNFYRSLAFGGHIGAAESYVREEWTTDDLTAVIRLLARNREVLDGLETGLARVSQPFLAFLRWANRNTHEGSARNIKAHYDLGNDFFAAFLDETMTYSAGVFPHEKATLREASVEKYDRLCRKIDLGSDDHLIEIGTGWGGFAIHAASMYGCRVTTTTISREQHALATQRVKEAGLSDRVTILSSDYRDLTGQFTRLVSIEMVEAVGHQYLEGYFQKCADLLAPNGVAAIQAITVRDDWYDPRQRQVDFIKKYIFPGSFIPAISTLSSAASDTDLRIVDLEDITPHYAETLRQWRLRFLESWDEIEAMGFDDDFRRLWEFYFCYCEGGFAEAILGSVQLVFAKPLARTSIHAEQRAARIEGVA